MRVMLVASIPVEAGNAGIESGALQKVLSALVSDLKAEAAYFLSLDGQRTALIFCDLADTSQIPTLTEPFFMLLNAEVEIYPVMNAEDLGKGLPRALEAVKKYAS